MATAPINLRLTDDQASWIADRADRALTPGSAGTRIKTELDLWRHMLAAELRRQKWTLPEMGLIADILNSALVRDAVPMGIGTIAVEVMDARAGDEGSYGGKWGVDEMELIDKLLRIGPAADHALADAVSRWWATDGEHSSGGWATVGVRVVE